MSVEIADIYVRLSSEDQNKQIKSDESESIQNQKAMLIDYCDKMGWKINAIYCDEDYSGADNTRPEWNRMLYDCKHGICNIVVCKTLSRFSRDMEMVEKYIHGLFPEWGVRFVSVVDNADTNIKGNKKARQINGLINEWYLEDLSENIKSTLSSKRKQGQFVGSFAPYGYFVDKSDKNHLVIDKPAAAVVKQIFNMYINGFGYIAIAKKLNDNNIPPPCIRKKQLGLAYYNPNFERVKDSAPVWKDSSVYSIIRRIEYTGVLVQGRREVINYKTGKRRLKPRDEWDIAVGKLDPIISTETFLKAQKIRELRGRSQKIPEGNCHSLSGKVFCGVCGGSMWKMSYKLKGGRYNYLCCRTRKTASKLCDNSHSVELIGLEDAVRCEINKLLLKYFDSEKIGDLSGAFIGEDESALKAKIRELEKRIDQNTQKTDKMYLDRLDGIITADEFKRYRSAIDGSIMSDRSKLKELKDKLEFGKENRSLKKQKFIEKYKVIDKVDFNIIDKFIKRVIIDKMEDNGSRNITVEWKI